MRDSNSPLLIGSQVCPSINTYDAIVEKVGLEPTTTGFLPRHSTLWFSVRSTDISRDCSVSLFTDPLSYFSKLLSEQWDLNPRPSRWQRDALPLCYARIGGTGRIRTPYHLIFNQALYQMSYSSMPPVLPLHHTPRRMQWDSNPHYGELAR